MLFLWCRSIGDFEHSDWSIFKNHWRHCRGKYIKVVVLLTACLPPSLPSFLSILLLTTYLPPSFPSTSSLPLSLLPLLYFSPSLLSSSYYISPFFLSLLLTASQSSSSLLLLPHSFPSTSSLPLSLSFSILLLTSFLPPSSVILLTTTLLPSSQSSSSLLLSLIPIHHPHYLPPSFLSVIITTSPPSFLSFILTTSLPPSSQSFSPPLHPSFLSIRHLITSLIFPVILSSTSIPLSFFRLHPY